LTGTVSLILFSCSPQVIVSSWKSYPSREDSESVVIYKNTQDIPIESEKIGTLQATCKQWMENCDSVSIFSLAETKIKKAGGNALLITNFNKPTLWNNSTLSLNGDVFLVHNFSSPPDTAKENFTAKLYMGFGLGPETGISLLIPKISFYDFQDRKFLSTYYGIEGTIGVIHRPWLALNCLYGVKKSIFTFDTSVGVWWLPSDNRKDETHVGSHFHTTLNPKIGVKFWKVWLKGGSSIHLHKNYPKWQTPVGMTNNGKIGNMYYNFEILINLL